MTTTLCYRECRSWYLWFFSNRLSDGDYRESYPYEAGHVCDSRGLTVAI